MEKPKDIRVQIQREEMTKKLMEKLLEGLEEIKSGTANSPKEKESRKHIAEEDSQDESFNQESDDEDSE